MVAINDGRERYDLEQNSQQNAPGKPGHDCSKCDKVPAAIYITKPVGKDEYQGQLMINEVIFGYSLKMSCTDSSSKSEKAQVTTEFVLTDVDGKRAELGDSVREYLLTLVSAAALHVTMEEQMCGIGRIVGALERLVGDSNIKPEMSNTYSRCQEIPGDIRKFLDDYKTTRGQK